METRWRPDKTSSQEINRLLLRELFQLYVLALPELIADLTSASPV